MLPQCCLVDVVSNLQHRVVELFYIDIGASCHVNVSVVCMFLPPMVRTIPEQALHCALQGVTKVSNFYRWLIGGYTCSGVLELKGRPHNSCLD